MQPGTSRLLMLMISAAIAGCASQTERSSSGAAQDAVEYERVGGTSNVVTKEELERRAAAKAAAAAPVAEAAKPDYEPQREDVQYIDKPLDETAPAAVAVAPVPAPSPTRSAADDALPEFPITNEGPGAQAAAAAAADEDVEDLGEQADESVADENAAEEGVASESAVGETTEYPDEPEQAEADEVEDLGAQADESGTVSHPEDDLAQADRGISDPTEYPEEREEVEDLGTQVDESGTVTHPEDRLAQSDRGISEPTVYPDEPVKQAAAPVSVNFEAEPLFGFDKFAVRADQRKALDDFVAGLRGVDYDEITAVGHADRLGTEAYNQALSEKRAKAVKDYLVSRGVPAAKIHTEGKGESEPVTGDACKSGKRKAVIACLQPDRRVDVSVSGSKKN